MLLTLIFIVLGDLEGGNAQCLGSFDNRTKFVKVQFNPEKSPFIPCFVSKNAGGKHNNKTQPPFANGWSAHQRSK
jgi:hypothetical protein